MRIRYQNPDYDVFIDPYLSTIPLGERMEVFRQMVHHATDQLLLPLFHEPEPVLISNRLVIVGGKQGRAVQTWNVHESDVNA